ncbi:MAG: SRPBCC family protein [Acidobacteriota bacterium]
MMMKNSGALKITTPTDREVMLTRVFDAPCQLVFNALTKPELLKRWYGPSGWTMVVCEIDLRVGGKWRFVSCRPDGKTIGQHGVYREIVLSERLVNTESWEDWDAGETLVTTVLAEQDGKTIFTATMLFPSQEVRDTVLKSGLEHGAVEIYNKLAELLASTDTY